MLDKFIQFGNSIGWDNVAQGVKWVSDKTGITNAVNKAFESNKTDSPGEGTYVIDNPDPNNDKVISIISQATGLSYYLIKEEMRKKQLVYGSFLKIAEPRPVSSKKFIKDLENAGADVWWGNHPPDIIRGGTPLGSLLYHGELKPPYST